jgi:hypothetical protein
MRKLIFQDLTPLCSFVFLTDAIYLSEIVGLM